MDFFPDAVPYIFNILQSFTSISSLAVTITLLRLRAYNSYSDSAVNKALKQIQIYNTVYVGPSHESEASPDLATLALFIVYVF